MKTKKENPAPKQLGNLKSHLDNTNLPAQRARLLAWLREKPITTIQARHQLNILSPPARVFELRHNYNLNIVTHWSTEATPEGHKHRVAKYVLMPGAFWERNIGDE